MKYIFIVVVAILFVSCAPKMKETFPFSRATKIELLSYPMRSEWDSVRRGKKVYLSDIVENKKLVISSGIRERVILNEKLKAKLFEALFVTKISEYSVASCFNPRHAILFYNDKSEIIANIEICFECGGDDGSFEYDELGYEGLKPIGEIFREADIKYYGEGQE